MGMSPRSVFYCLLACCGSRAPGTAPPPLTTHGLQSTRERTVRCPPRPWNLFLRPGALGAAAGKGLSQICAMLGAWDAGDIRHAPSTVRRRPITAGCSSSTWQRPVPSRPTWQDLVGAGSSSMMTVRPTTAGGGRSSALPTDLLMARLDKRQMMHALEARVLEHDATIRRHDAKLRRQRAASLQELKRAGQALLEVHDDRPTASRAHKPAAGYEQLRRAHEDLAREHERLKRKVPARSVNPAAEAAVAPHSLALELERLELENAELRAALQTERSYRDGSPPRPASGGLGARRA